MVVYAPDHEARPRIETPDVETFKGTIREVRACFSFTRDRDLTDKLNGWFTTSERDLDELSRLRANLENACSEYVRLADQRNLSKYPGRYSP